jgi:hypothetical protein
MLTCSQALHDYGYILACREKNRFIVAGPLVEGWYAEWPCPPGLGALAAAPALQR